MTARLLNWYRQSPLHFIYKRVSPLPDYLYWRLRGSPGIKIPHFLKERALRNTAREFRLRVLVETGTQYGQMAHAMRNNFLKIYSIELREDLYKAAKRNLAPYSQIEILQGDSAVVLPELLRKLTPPIMFWLDAHGGGTPLLKELGEILRDPEAGNVILIDDVHAYKASYWSLKLDDITQFIACHSPRHRVELRDNLLYILPGNR